MFRSSYKIATVWGIPIKIHFSLIILGFIIAVWGWKDELLFGSPVLAMLDRIMVFVGVFISIALHELGHSFVAIRKGSRVREITLMFLGGAAQMTRIPARPMNEFQMAIAGPAVSFILGAIGVWIGPKLMSHSSLIAYMFGLVFFKIGIVNFALGIFNLIPAFPTDGGRVLRALLSAKFGRLRATLIAVRVSKIVCLLGGISAYRAEWYWLTMIAIYLYIMSGREYEMVRREESLYGRMYSSPPPEEDFHTNRDDDKDQVTISPPPYKSGPGTKADLRPADPPNPFKNLFRL